MSVLKTLSDDNLEWPLTVISDPDSQECSIYHRYHNGSPGVCKSYCFLRYSVCGTSMVGSVPTIPPETCLTHQKGIVVKLLQCSRCYPTRLEHQVGKCVGLKGVFLP